MDLSTYSISSILPVPWSRESAFCIHWLLVIYSIREALDAEVHSLHNTNTAKKQHNVIKVSVNYKYHKQQNLLLLDVLNVAIC